MNEIHVRKRGLTIDRVFHDGGPINDVPLLKGAVVVALANPFAGRFADGAELKDWMEALRSLARRMAGELTAALVGQHKVQTFGKRAIEGASGEIGHGAIWHAPGGAAVREARGGARAQVSSSKKIRGMGSQLDFPLHYIRVSTVRTHNDVMPVTVPDGPKPAEIVFAAARSTGPRFHARIDGLAVEDAKTGDGLK